MCQEPRFFVLVHYNFLYKMVIQTKDGPRCKINLTWGILGRVEQARQSKGPSDLEDSCQKVMQVLGTLTKFLQNHPHLIQVAARDIANTIAHIYVGKSCSYYFLLL